MSYYHRTKAEFDVWFTNFAAVCTTNAATLKLDPAELATITAAKTGYHNALLAQEAARDAARGATFTCDEQWGSSLELLSTLNQQFQADPDVSGELLNELGLNVRRSPSPVPVTPPSNVAAWGDSTGTNTVEWTSNGNTTGTLYIVQAAYDGTEEWTTIDQTSVVRYEHVGQTPGRFVRYRVYAQRGRRKSGLSNTASVYAPPQTLTVEEGGQAAA
jgi:hypothetical protein